MKNEKGFLSLSCQYYSTNNKILEFKNGFLIKCSKITCFHEIFITSDLKTYRYIL